MVLMSCILEISLAFFSGLRGVLGLPEKVTAKALWVVFFGARLATALRGFMVGLGKRVITSRFRFGMPKPGISP